MNTVITNKTADPNASARIADFIVGFRNSTLNDEHYEHVARAVIDTVAVSYAGIREPAAALMRDYLHGRRGAHAATAWGTGLTMPLEDAALYNGTAGHVLDFDDVTSPMRGHPSIALLPSLLALAEAFGKSGRDLAMAYIAGFEIIVKLAKVMVADHYAKGWHSTSTVGVIGATAACALLLGLERQQIVHALGLAVSQASGSRANFGSMGKSFQAGHCGAAAVRAVMLSRLGFDSAAHAMDGDYGYMALYASSESLVSSLETLGRHPLEVLSSGLEIKKYPLCYATHRGIDGMLDLRASHGLVPDQIADIAVTSNYRGMAPLIYSSPKTGLEAKFSMQYAIAAAAYDGFVKLDSFADEAVRRPEIQDFMKKISATEDKGPQSPRWNRLVVTLKSGATIDKTVTQLRGGTQFPLSRDQLLEKARDCFQYSGLTEPPELFFRNAFAIQAMSVRDMISALSVAI